MEGIFHITQITKRRRINFLFDRTVQTKGAHSESTWTDVICAALCLMNWKTSDGELDPGYVSYPFTSSHTILEDILGACNRPIFIRTICSAEDLGKKETKMRRKPKYVEPFLIDSYRLWKL